MQVILEYLKENGARFDSEIATATGIPLVDVRTTLTTLSAQGAVILCRSVRFKEGQEIEAVFCRVAGYIPPAYHSQKPKVRI